MSYFLSSPPIDIDFLGFRGNSVELQRRGWMFSFEREYHRNAVRIAMRHGQANMYAMISDFDLPRHNPMEHRPIPTAFINYVAPEVRIMSSYNPFASFNAIDMEPAMLNIQEWKMSGADIFRRLEPVAEQKKIFLAESSEMELLQTLMQKQQPMQDEIRERLRRAERNQPLQTVEAQIIKLSNWR